jgi:CubicO group peptidase (beta-lactamase class C family)
MMLQPRLGQISILASMFCALLPIQIANKPETRMKSPSDFVQQPASAQASDSPQSDGNISAVVDAYVEDQRREQQIPGIAIGVIRDGVLIKARGYGLANIELNVPVKPETVFQTGSVGKQFTAAAIMILVEERKVGLDDRISKYLPGTPEVWKSITVRNLLTHTSGIPDYESDNAIDLRADYTEDELFQKLCALPLSFGPGEKFVYSNKGYVLLGFLIHKVTGEFYGDFLQERIFRPLGMTSTRIISEADIIPNRAAGYRLVNGEIKNQEWVSPTLNTTADGALYTNVLDMAKWDAALYTDKLLKKGSLDQMWSAVRLNDGKTAPYGFGWDVTDVNGHRLIEHGGSWQGFATHISRYANDRFTVVVLTNLNADRADPKTIAHSIASLYIPAVSPGAAKAIEDREPHITSLVRTTLADLTAGHANLKSFEADQRQVWVPERTEGLTALLKSLGTLQAIDLLEREEENGSKTYKYRTVFAHRTMTVNFGVDRHGLISGFQIRPW